MARHRSLLNFTELPSSPPALQGVPDTGTSNCEQGRIQDLPKEGRGPDHGERGTPAYNGGLGSEPQWGQGGEPLVGVSGAKPP